METYNKENNEYHHFPYHEVGMGIDGATIKETFSDFIESIFIDGYAISASMQKEKLNSCIEKLTGEDKFHIVKSGANISFWFIGKNDGKSFELPTGRLQIVTSLCERK